MLCGYNCWDDIFYYILFGNLQVEMNTSDVCISVHTTADIQQIMHGILWRGCGKDFPVWDVSISGSGETSSSPLPAECHMAEAGLVERVVCKGGNKSPSMCN